MADPKTNPEGCFKYDFGFPTRLNYCIWEFLFELDDEDTWQCIKEKFEKNAVNACKRIMKLNDYEEDEIKENLEQFKQKIGD